MQTPYEKLEFTAIKEMLAEHALSENDKKQCRTQVPETNENSCHRQMHRSTGARAILDAKCAPPVTAMEQLADLLPLCPAGPTPVPSPSGQC